MTKLDFYGYSKCKVCGKCIDCLECVCPKPYWMEEAIKKHKLRDDGN